ncbi:hypothetical protein ABK040_005606 [Willaertia magna]
MNQFQFNFSDNEDDQQQQPFRNQKTKLTNNNSSENYYHGDEYLYNNEEDEDDEELILGKELIEPSQLIPSTDLYEEVQGDPLIKIKRELMKQQEKYKKLKISFIIIFLLFIFLLFLFVGSSILYLREKYFIQNGNLNNTAIVTTTINGFTNSFTNSLVNGYLFVNNNNKLLEQKQELRQPMTEEEKERMLRERLTIKEKFLGD